MEGEGRAWWGCGDEGSEEEKRGGWIEVGEHGFWCCTC